MSELKKGDVVLDAHRGLIGVVSEINDDCFIAQRHGVMTWVDADSARLPIMVDPSKVEYLEIPNQGTSTFRFVQPWNRELVRFEREVAARVEAACARLKALLRADATLTMRDAIAAAADAEGCAREDLCSYLLALGIGSLR